MITVERIIQIILGALLGMFLAVLVHPAAQAHTESQIEEWLAEWEQNPDPIELRDFAERHSCQLLGTGCPAPASRSATTRAAGKSGAGQTYSSGVEQWRGLVAAYFPGEVDFALAVMACESGGNPSAYNPSGASGLFQVKPFHVSDRGVSGDLFNPEFNVSMAAWVKARYGWSAWACA